MKERQFTIIVLLLVQYLCNSISDKKPHQGRIRKYRKVRVRVSEKKKFGVCCYNTNSQLLPACSIHSLL